jgi:fumarate hydratase subunit alpha
MGLGGCVTALAIHIDQVPTHIAALPVAVNMQCHCARHAHRVIAGVPMDGGEPYDA